MRTFLEVRVSFGRDPEIARVSGGNPSGSRPEIFVGFPNLTIMVQNDKDLVHLIMQFVVGFWMLGSLTAWSSKVLRLRLGVASIPL